MVSPAGGQMHASNQRLHAFAQCASRYLCYCLQCHTAHIAAFKAQANAPELCNDRSLPACLHTGWMSPSCVLPQDYSGGRRSMPRTFWLCWLARRQALLSAPMSQCSACLHAAWKPMGALWMLCCMRRGRAWQARLDCTMHVASAGTKGTWLLGQDPEVRPQRSRLCVLR